MAELPHTIAIPGLHWHLTQVPNSCRLADNSRIREAKKESIYFILALPSTVSVKYLLTTMEDIVLKVRTKLLDERIQPQESHINR